MLAVIVSVVEPVRVAVVLARVAVPLPLSVNVTPVGRVPVTVSVSAEIGNPVVVTVNVPAVPAVNVAAFALVIAGAWSTVRVKVWVALGVTPLAAVKVRGYVPPVPAAGVPLSTPVAALNVTPLGNVPLSLSVGVGAPVAVTVKVLPAVPAVKVALLALVMAGAELVTVCVRVPVLVVKFVSPE